MAKERSAILELHRRGKRQCEIVRLLNVPQQTVSKGIRRYEELGHEGDRPGRGRKPTRNTSRLRTIIKKRVLRKSQVSMRKIAREVGVNRGTVRKIAKNGLRLKPFKLQRAQRLTDVNKKIRLQRCRELKVRAAGQNWERFLFTDEEVVLR